MRLFRVGISGIHRSQIIPGDSQATLIIATNDEQDDSHENEHENEHEHENEFEEQTDENRESFDEHELDEDSTDLNPFADEDDDMNGRQSYQ